MARVTLSDKAKPYEKMIIDLAKVHTLYVQYIQRHTSYRCMTMGDYHYVLQGGKNTCTYKYAVECLKRQILQKCKNDTIINMITDLEKRINESDLKDMKFGMALTRFTEIEKELDSFLLTRQLYMTNEIMPIKYISEKIGIPISTIKSACQSERLLNTKKVGNGWLAHLGECANYWNKNPYTEKNLYYNVKY